MFMQGSNSGSHKLLSRLSRRSMVRLLGLSAIALPLGATRREAAASHAWCRTDPVIMVDGELADIFISAPIEAPLLVTGPTEVVVSIPVGVEASVIATGVGFGKGEVVSFVEAKNLKKTARGIELKIAVYVPATDDEMPVLVEFAPRIIGLLSPASAEGTANEWVTLKTVM